MKVTELARYMTTDPEMLRKIEAEYGGAETEGPGDAAQWRFELGTFIAREGRFLMKQATTTLGRKGESTETYGRGLRLLNEGEDAKESA